MSQDAVTKAADVVLQQINNAADSLTKGDLLISLPVYLDTIEVRHLQMETNHRCRLSIELQHRPGERRVGERLVLPAARRSH